MLRKYVRKSTRNDWDADAMALAIAAVDKKEMGYRKTAKTFEVPKTTLMRRCNGNIKQAKGTAKTLDRVVVSNIGLQVLKSDH